jgi:hypothetical protein
MNRLVLFVAAAAVGGAAAGLLLWPKDDAGAQVTAEGCKCSSPAQVGTGREQLTVVHCVCPGTQCVITATAAGTVVPPNVVQSCR